jgi:hypothetical protein
MGLFSFLKKDKTSDEIKADLYKKLPHIQTRVAVSTAYDEGWKLGMENGKSPDQCHELATIQVLVKFMESMLGGARPTVGEMAQYARWESLPFIKMPRKAGRDALEEYLVWRIYPDNAKRDVIKAAVENLLANLKENGHDELIKEIQQSELFASIAWRRLI